MESAKLSGNSARPRSSVMRAGCPVGHLPVVGGVELAVRPGRNQLVVVELAPARAVVEFLVALDQLDRVAPGVLEPALRLLLTLDGIGDDAVRELPLAVPEPF